MKKLTFLLMLVAVAGCGKPASESVAPADLVLLNGNVKTPSGWAEAVAVTDGRIFAVGDSESIARFRGDATRLIELGGNTVLPGFHDVHVHPLFGGMTYSGANNTICNIAQGSTLEELREAIVDCVENLREGDWLTGGQWDASTIGRVPNRQMIDDVTGDYPAILNDTSGHSALANTKALEIAGVTKDTPDPPGGIIERDANGEPTGVLREAAIGVVRMHVPPPSDQVIRESLTWALATMLASGITSFTEASNGFIAGSKRELDLYAQLADEGVLKQRVRICVNWLPDNWTPGEPPSNELIENRASWERDRIRVDCVKFFLDGVPTDSHTAAMLAPYADTVEGRDDEASRYGMLLLEQNVTNDAVIELDKQGLTVKFHVAGDAAVRSGLDAIEAARNANGMNELRHNVAHCTFVHPDDFSRSTELHATFELSPYLWAPTPISNDIHAAVGDERADQSWPFRSLIDAGALVVPGSDWAVVPSVSPWIGLEAMVTREAPGGSEEHFGKPQAITVEEAIDLFTVQSAIHMGTYDDLGEIAVGKIADIIVIDQNPYTVATTDIHKTNVLMTFIEGELVFEAD